MGNNRKLLSILGLLLLIYKSAGTSFTCQNISDFKCQSSNVCVPKNDVCNGVVDCSDGSDESDQACEIGTLKCRWQDNRFLCDTMDECIDLEKICDGKADCADGSDEQARLCNEKNKSIEEQCKNCKELGECKVLPFRTVCFCKDGYQFNNNTRFCEDINECEIFGTCSQGCVNQNGSYFCTCAKGFLLNNNNMSCDTISTNVSLIYTTRNMIKKLEFGQKNIYYHSIVSKTKQSIGVAFDGEFYYWTEVDLAREVIVKYNPSTKSREILLTNGLELPEYIAVDWLTKNIYFTDSSRRHIAVCSNDGYYCTELVKIDIMHYPRAIALHPTDGLLFWTDWGNNSHIGVSLMDGSGAKVLVDNVNWPNGLALDWANRRIYWIDALSHTIESVKINGEDRRVILEGVFKHPFSLEVFGDKLYWSDHDTKSIEYCDKFTGKNHDVLIQGDEIFDVHIYDHSSMPYSKHGCEGNPCSHICLLKNNGSYSCACPMEMELQSDNHNCRFNSQSFVIHVGIGSKLYTKPFLSFGRSVENALKSADGKIDKLEFNSLNGAIFYADNENHKLFVLDTIGNSHLVFENPNLHITSMSFDYLGNNLYWSDAMKGTIEVLSIHTKKHSIVHHYTGDYHPNSIVVVPTEGEIFVALVSQIDSQINRVSMKGSSMDESKFQLIRSGLGKGGNFYLAVDEKEKKLYWSDTQKKRIEFAFLNGTERKIFIDTDSAPGPLTIVDNYLHWTSEGSKSMQWRRKNGTGPVKLIEINDTLQISDFPKILPITTGNPIKINNHLCAVNNGGCSDICISDGQTGKACLCGTGRIFRNNDQRECIEKSSTFNDDENDYSSEVDKDLEGSVKFIYVFHNEIRLLDREKIVLLHDAGSPISDMAMDKKKNILMFSIIGKSGLYILNVTSSIVDIIDEFPFGLLLSYNWIDENIYILSHDAFHNPEIYVCSFKSKKCELIYKGNEGKSRITSIDVDPIQGYLFFIKETLSTTSKDKTEIVKTGLNGENKESLIQAEKQSVIRALSIDIQTQTIYFTEQTTRSLLSIDYQGEGMSSIIQNSKNLMAPSMLTNFDNHAYILDEWHGKISVCKLDLNNECIKEIKFPISKRFIIAPISKQIQHKIVPANSELKESNLIDLNSTEIDVSTQAIDA